MFCSILMTRMCKKERSWSIPSNLQSPYWELRTEKYINWYFLSFQIGIYWDWSELQVSSSTHFQIFWKFGKLEGWTSIRIAEGGSSSIGYSVSFFSKSTELSENFSFSVINLIPFSVRTQQTISDKLVLVDQTFKLSAAVVLKYIENWQSNEDTSDHHTVA